MPPILFSPAFLRELAFLFSLFIVGAFLGFLALGAPPVRYFEVLVTAAAAAVFSFVAALLFTDLPPR